jgi:hypothetical protein
MGAPHHIRDQAEDARHLLRLKTRYCGRLRTSAAFTDEDWEVQGPHGPVARARRLLGAALDEAVEMTRSGSTIFGTRFRTRIVEHCRFLERRCEDFGAELQALNVFLERFGLRLDEDGKLYADPSVAAKWMALNDQLYWLPIRIRRRKNARWVTAMQARAKLATEIAQARAGVACVRRDGCGMYHEVRLPTLLREAECDAVHQLEAETLRLEAELADAHRRDWLARTNQIQL